MAVHVSKILGEEGITFDPKDIVSILDSYYPDIRKVINTCQLNSSKGTLKVDTQNILDGDLKNKIVTILKSNDDKRNKYMNIRQAIADTRVQDFTEFYTYLYEKVDDYASGNTSNVILTLAEGQSKDALVVDKEITFMATIIQINNII